MAPTFLRANNESFAHEIGGTGGLVVSSFTGNVTGTDPVLGIYTEHRWAFETTGSGDGHSAAVSFEASARAFQTTPTIIFTQRFPDGVADYGYGDAIDLAMRREPNWGTPGTAWPALQPRQAAPVEDRSSMTQDWRCRIARARRARGRPTPPHSAASRTWWRRPDGECAEDHLGSRQ